MPPESTAELRAHPRLKLWLLLIVAGVQSLVPAAIFWVGTSRGQPGAVWLAALFELVLLGTLAWVVIGTRATWVVLTPEAIRWSVRGRKGASSWERLAGLQPMLHTYRVITADGFVELRTVWEGADVVLGSLQARRFDPTARFDRGRAS